jgi:hypothetical protein
MASKGEPMTKPWSVQILTFEIKGLHCHVCNVNLTAEQLLDPRGIHQEHMGHISDVWASAMVVSLSEYRGMEMKLPGELLTAQNQSGAILAVPCTIFKLSCQECHIDSTPLTAADVRRFRSHHSPHIDATRVHAVTHTPVGQVIVQVLSVTTQCSSDQLSSAVDKHLFSPLAMSQFQKLRNLGLCLHCRPRGLDCRRCKSKQYFEDSSGADSFLAIHRDHMHFLYLHLSVTEPQEYQGLRLRLLAHTFPAQSLAVEMRIDCMMLEIAAKNGAPPITPWGRADIDRYLDSNRHGGGVRLRALVFGRAGRIFERDIDIARAIRSQQPDRMETLPNAEASMQWKESEQLS